MATTWVPVREAWETALYGPAGFYRRERPRDHFRTSVHASPLFAAAVVTLARRHDLTDVTDVGAGAGELVSEVHRLAPDLTLTGVDVRSRPAGLDPAVRWVTTLPERLTGLVLANELLDDLPCSVVERDAAQRLRVVEVDPTGGGERWGEAAPAAEEAWVHRWWPLAEGAGRAEVGLTREDFWADVCDRTTQGVCLAIDYGHLREARPPGGSLASYRSGRMVPVRFDGSCDVTAHVAMDALAERVGGSLLRQRDALHELGISGARPPVELAASEPVAYLRALARAGEAAELTGSPGLGDFWWLLTERP